MGVRILSNGMKVSYPEPENYWDDKCENLPSGDRCRNLKVVGSKFCASCDKEIKQKIRNEKREDWLTNGVALSLSPFVALFLGMVIGFDSLIGATLGAFAVFGWLIICWLGSKPR